MDTQLTRHFNVNEFTCKCGCRTNHVQLALAQRLEKLYEYLETCEGGVSAVIVTSGYRCPRHSVAAGGAYDDAHTKGIAADIYALKSDGASRWDSCELAAVAERVGFTGIGIIDNTAVHCDIRNSTNYKNSHWFGDERSGNDNVSTFADFLPDKAAEKIGETKTVKHKIAVYIDGAKAYESEV